MINRTVSSEADHSRPPMSGKAGANLTCKACFPEPQVFLIHKYENTGLYQCFLNVVNISLKNIRWVIVVVIQKTCLWREIHHWRPSSWGFRRGWVRSKRSCNYFEFNFIYHHHAYKVCMVCVHVWHRLCVWKLQDTFWELVLSLYCELLGFNSGCQPYMTNTFFILLLLFSKKFIYLFYILATVSPPF